MCDYYGINYDSDFYKSLQRIIIESDFQLVTNKSVAKYMGLKKPSVISGRH